MKNLKVKTKILIGFGSVIIMMVVIAVTVLFSNFDTIQNVSNVEQSSALQTMGKNLMMELDRALLGNKTIELTINNEAYTQADQALDACYSIVDDMTELIDETPSLKPFMNQVNAAADVIRQMDQDMADLQDANTQMALLQIKTRDAGRKLQEQMGNIFSDQIGLAKDEGAFSADRARRISQSVEIMQSVSAARIKANIFIETFDPANGYNETISLVEEARVTLKDLIANSTVDKTRTTGEALLKVLDEYTQAIEKFNDENNRALLAISDSGISSANAQAMIDQLMVSLDDEMSLEIGNASKTAATSLIVVSIILAAAIAVAVVMALIIMQGITVPVDLMAKAAEKLAVGDTDVSVDYHSRDELGHLAEAFRRMANGIQEQVSCLEQLAEGDFSLDVEMRSDKDSMNLAIHSMIGKINHTFSEISMASDQVATGTGQIASGAQSLAQGATEQAASIEQLASAMSEITEGNKRNAALAESADSLATNIRHNAQQGSEQMNQMLDAIKQISESSESIGKVIKVIDDIAFQTNILALNAAVEAARAGVQGKGFAVVAEEVRNLAAKSAEAAKDTAGLIENSIKRAELGSQIAVETAASLEHIVAEINESGEMISNIARATNEQLGSISEINLGIDQVAQVVQQNSAISEQSAASAEEMSSQSLNLNAMIAYFKLKSDVEMDAQMGTPIQLAASANRNHRPVMSSSFRGKY